MPCGSSNVVEVHLSKLNFTHVRRRSHPMDYYGFTEVQTSWKDTNFLGLVRCGEENTKGRGEKGGGERKGEGKRE